MNPRVASFLGFVLVLLFGRKTGEEILRSARIVNRGGNRWGRVWVTGPIAIWLGSLYAISANNWADSLRWFVWLMPLLALGACLVWFPTIFAIAGGVVKARPEAKSALQTSAHAIGWLLAVGLGIAFGPVHNDPFVVAMVLGLVMVAYLWNAGDTSYWSVLVKKWGTRALVATIVILVVSLFFGGRREASDRGKSLVTRTSNQAEAAGKDLAKKAVSLFEAPPPIPPAPPPTILLGCNGNEQEMPMPIGGVVYRLGPKCTSGWIPVPDKMPDGRWAPGFRIEPKQLVLVRKAFGKINPDTGEPITEESVHVSAFTRTKSTKRATGLRIENKNSTEVLIPINPM